MAYNTAAKRFRPVGSRRKKAPQYSPEQTGCPVVEQAVARLYRGQDEENFWGLMNALNYALELNTRVLMPLDAAVDPQSEPAQWARLPIPEERAKGLQPWLLHTRKERHYLPVFTSTQNAEIEKATATRPMAEYTLRDAMEYALDTEGIDGLVLDPWSSSATLDSSLLGALLKSERGGNDPGDSDVEEGLTYAREGDWAQAADCFERAAMLGNIRGLSLSAECLYKKRGRRQNRTEARKLWKRAAKEGDVLAMLALGDDCAASGGESAAALQYYRRARNASVGTPDIAYTPQIELRLAQYETQYISRKKALLQLAEAVQGLRILRDEGEPDAAALLAEAEALTAALLADTPAR